MKLLVLDGNSIINRAFYGIRLLSTKDGQYTNAIVGFLNILNKAQEETQPDVVAVAFDLPAPTFRHLAYDGYKAGRKKMPEELAAQLPVLKQLLRHMGLPILEAEGFEADDILGTEAHACGERGDTCVLLTGDRDSFQLVAPTATVRLAATKAGQPVTTIYDEAAIREQYGVTPTQMIDVKALMGDASDNIPGVAGVGEKTALSLMQTYGSLDAIYAHLEDAGIRPALRAKLQAGKDSAYMSQKLAKIRIDAPVETDPTALANTKEDGHALALLMAKLELFKLMEKMGVTADMPAQAGAPDAQKTICCAIAPDGMTLLARLHTESPVNFACRFAENEYITGIAFALADGIACALEGQTAGFDAFLSAFFADGALGKRTHDSKPVYAAGMRQGFTIADEEVGDTMLAAYLLNPLASSYLPARLCEEYTVFPPTVENAPEELAACVTTALTVQALAPVLLQKLADNGQERLYHEVELPLARVLAQMEHIGFMVDEAGIAAYGETLGKKLTAMEQEIVEAVGYPFNLNSPKQLGEALFVKLGLPHGKKTKTGWSTNADVLDKLKGAHPVIDTLLGFRKLSKLKSTYTDGLLKVIAPDGRIHSSFNQVETRTGRISSTEPNLQNIPVRSEEGRELRRFFVARPGWVLVDADYSQIELRILAHIANDTAMISAFNSHEDIHTITASQVFGMPPEYVTPIMRSRAKAVNFGIVYGIGAFSLSQDIGVSVKEADSYIKGYLQKFSGVRDYMEKVIREAHEKGYVETLFGRRRMLPELLSSNHNMRAFGERVARNTPIQGTAADIIKIAMVRVRDRLENEKLQSVLILQVHDELIVEAPEAEAAQAGRILEEEMEGAMQLRVKLEADVHTGRTWYDAKG
ncbi:DNA polymerase I [Ethanoligenens sp.]|uniref:DNA polymerase I n=1 Tax=Ethanoligenens sp. TaxID=2099655 RepID=UPI0039E977CC